eukprot:jgi/Galph1/4287/GphlegSOOS_G2893.1
MRTSTKTLCIQVKFPSGEEKYTSLCIQAFYDKRTVNNKLFSFQLFDENDPFLFYEYRCDETSFLALKTQHHLVIDFEGFATKFYELVDSCKTDKEKFQASLLITDDETASFVVEENTQFRKLTYLSLELKIANREVIRNYFKQVISSAQQKIENLQESVDTLETKVQEERNRVNELNSKLYSSHAEAESKLQQVEERYQEELEHLRLQHKKERDQWIQDEESHKTEMETRLKEQVNEWKNKYERSEQRISLLSEQVTKSQQDLLQAQTQKDELQRRLQEVESEVETLKREKTEQMESINKKHKDFLELESKREELETQVTELQRTIKYQSNQLEEVIRNEFLQKQQEDLMKQLEFYRNGKSRLEEKLKQCIAEINKGNCIIEKLQGELKSVKQKAKMKSTISSQQEELLKEKERKLEQLVTDIQTWQQKAKSKDREIEQLHQSLEAAHRKLEENEKVLESNQQLINWLNKELNEMQLSHYIVWKPGKHSNSSSGMKPMESSFHPPSTEKKALWKHQENMPYESTLWKEKEPSSHATQAQLTVDG